MSIRFVVGRAGSGKTYKIFEEIKEKLKAEPERKLMLIVPQQFTLQSEYDLISKMDLEGIMQVEVLSFERLAHMVFNEVGGLKRIDIDDLGKVMVLRNLFDEHMEELKVYKKVSKQDGFLRNFNGLVTEFKRNDITTEGLLQELDGIEADEMLRNKLKDIAFMYEKFNGYMEGRYTDEEDKNNMLIEALDDAKSLEGAEIWIDGFMGFSSQEYRIIEKLLRTAKRVTISLTLDIDGTKRDADIFQPNLDAFLRLRKMAREDGIEEDEKHFFNLEHAEGRVQELQHIEKQFYAYPYKTYGGPVNNIEVFSGLNQYTEIENTAAKIIDLVRDKGYRWRDIAVVTGSLEHYGMTIKRVFTEYGIPFFLDEKREIMNNPIIKFILSSINIVQRYFRYEDVFRFIKTGFSNLDRSEYERLENYVLKYGIKGEKWFHDFKYGQEEDLEAMNVLRLKFIEPFLPLKNGIKGKQSVHALTKHFFNFLKTMDLENKINLWIEDLNKKGHLDYVNENTQIWNIVMGIFDQLVKIMGDKTVDMKAYHQILQAGFSEYKVGVIPPTIDQVLVGTLDRSKSHDIKALFVVGVNDGVLPAAFDDGGLLLDEEKLLLKEKGVNFSSDSQTKVNEERLSIYSSFVKPEAYLWVSYALSDMEGKALRPSVLIHRFKKLFPSLVVQSDMMNDEGRQRHLISRPMSTFKYLAEQMRNYVDDYKIEPLWWDVYEWYLNHETWQHNVDAMISGLFHKNQEDYMLQDRAKSLYQVPLRSSISRLEKFVNCPFSHFINYGLKPKERKEYKLELPDIGNLFHDSVEEFARVLKQEDLNWRDIDKTKSDQIIETIIDGMVPDFQNNILQSTHRYKYLINKLKRIGKRAAWTVTQQVQQGEFEPIEYELEFSEKGYIPPIVIEMPDGEEIILEGRIDRVDLLKQGDGAYVKVVDYKSGKKRFSLSEVYYGLQIQLMIYLDAVLQNGDKLIQTKRYPGGVFYFKIDDPMVKTDNGDEVDIEQEIFKQLKLDGMVVKDIEVIKAMDASLETERKSSIIPVSLKKDGELSSRSQAVSQEDIGHLMQHIKNLVSDIGSEILKGNIRVEPCKVENKTSCDYCQYQAVCQFDTSLEDNAYKNLKKLKDDAVLDRVRPKDEQTQESGGETDA